MTLFKKVFQTQSRPATEEETLDDAELRRAFLETEVSEPMKLDPFGPVEDKEDETATVAVEDLSQPLKGMDTSMYGENSFDHGGDFLSKTDDLECEEAETAGLQDERDDKGATTNVPEADFEEKAAQADFEVAAFLDRAMATELEEPAQNDKSVEPLAHCDEDSNTAEETKRDVCEASPEEAECDDTIQMSNIAATEEESASDFAREQLALMGARNDASVAEFSSEPSAEIDLSADTDFGAMSAPATGRAARRAGRVKTRLLGFNRGADTESDPFGQAPETTATAQSEKFPVGWLVIVEGPGVGHAFSLFTGASVIGRGEDQVIRLDFGDNSISRQNHAAIAFDEEQNKFYIGHGGKSNIIRRNARPVLSTEELQHADLIRIGETTLRFVALCGSDFQWKTAGGSHADAV